MTVLAELSGCAVKTFHPSIMQRPTNTPIASSTAKPEGTFPPDGVILPAHQLPSYIPEILRKEWYQRPKPPVGWTAVTPHGGAITTSGAGTIEIKEFKLLCNVPGRNGKQLIYSDTSQIGGALYLKDPWFGGNDLHENADIRRTPSGTVIIKIPDHRVAHWWTARPTLPAGTNNCATEAVVRGTGNVIVAVGADWWKTSDAMWAGLNVNNQEIGVGNWYDLGNGQWQTVYMRPG